MPLPILRRSTLLSLPQADRLALLEMAVGEIEAEIERLRSSSMRIWYGRSPGSWRFHLQSLYARRQRLVELARETGCGDRIRELTEAA